MKAGYPRSLESHRTSSQWEVTRSPRPMRALGLFILQIELCTNMRRMQLLGYSLQPGCSARPVSCVSVGLTFVGYTMFESAVRPNSYPKSSVSQEVEPSGICVTEGGYQVGPHFQTGCNKVITCASMVGKKSNSSHCWLPRDIDNEVWY